MEASATLATSQVAVLPSRRDREREVASAAARLRSRSDEVVAFLEAESTPAVVSRRCWVTVLTVLAVVLACALIAAPLGGSGAARPTVCSGMAAEVGVGGFVLVAVRTGVGSEAERCGDVSPVSRDVQERRYLESAEAARRAAARVLGRDAWATPAAATPRGVVGGSAGLVLALDIVDRAHAGALSRGRRVAATGVVSPAGEVAVVTGVSMKVAAAERAGAELILVPHANLDEALAAARTAQVIGVSTLEEAVAALRAD